MRFIAFGFVGITVASNAQTLTSLCCNKTALKDSQEWQWDTGEPGVWNVWLDVDAGVVELFELNDANNDIRRAAVLGHPEWNSNTLTNVVNRMTNLFDNAVYGVDSYPASLRENRRVPNGLEHAQCGLKWGAPPPLPTLNARVPTAARQWLRTKCVMPT